MAVPNIFANASGTILLSELDTNFATPVTIGTTPVVLGDSVSAVVGLTLNNSPIGNATRSTGAFTTLTSSSVANLSIDGNAATANTVITNANLTGGVTSIGNAATVVTNANLTGAVTSVGNASLLGSFTSLQLLTALTDQTGTGVNVFATSPTLVSPALGTPSALVGTNITGTATNFTASNVTTNANLTGAVTSVGNATLLGSFTSAQLATALTNETGSGSAVFSVSPTFTGTVNTAALTAAGAVTITGAFALRGSYGAGADTNSFAAGDRALDSNTTGGGNTAVGVDALTTNTQGGENVAVGFYSLKSNTIGVYNVGVGTQALTGNSTGESNTAVGALTLPSNTTGSSNTTVGRSSLNSNTVGADNTAVGVNSLNNNTNGNYNTALGSNALNSNISGSFNTAVGDYSLSNTTGSYNTAVGDDSGLGLTSGSYNQVFGNGITLAAGSTGRIGIGSLFTHPTNNAVVIGNGTNRISNSYTVNATWAFSSDERIKNVIGKDTLGLTFINDLEPVTYRWKPSNEIPKELTAHYAEENVQDTNVIMHGLIAQNVKAALDKAGVDTFTGWSEDEDGTQRLGIADLITPMINAIKELTARLEALEGKL